MTAPHRCLVCGSLNEPYASRCSCGASLDISAGDSRDAIVRRMRTAAWTAALWAVVAVVLVGVTFTLSTGGLGAFGGVSLLGAVVGTCAALAACLRELRSLVRARANLAAIPDLPRAALRR